MSKPKHQLSEVAVPIPNEQLIEDIAVLFLKAVPEGRDSQSDTVSHIAHNAEDMAQRAARGWFSLVGAPDYTRRLKNLKRRLKKEGINVPRESDC